jgi:hypothetical protein
VRMPAVGRRIDPNQKNAFERIFAISPEGLAEMVHVENLAMIAWRKQRLFRAETAQIEEAVEFKNYDSASAQALEAWDRARAGQTPGGMLRGSSNSFVVRKAKEILTLFRDNFEKCGFQKDEDAWVLKKIYGLDGDDAAPFNPLQVFLTFSEAAREGLGAGETSTLPDELKKAMVELFDTEIERLDALAKFRLELEGRRSEHQITAALIPAQGDLDRIIRYEAHLTREYDRLLSQLEHLQRIRLGQPTPPTIRLEI